MIPAWLISRRPEKGEGHRPHVAVGWLVAVLPEHPVRRPGQDDARTLSVPARDGTAGEPHAVVLDRPLVLAEERQLQAVPRLGVLAVGLRLEQMVPRHAVVVGGHLPVRLCSKNE
jgi:hypothetical protein